MKLKLYFLANLDEVVAGPFFSIEQAISGREKLSLPLKSLVKIVRIDGHFNLIDVE